MSSIPKARKSNINDLVVTPDSWDSYPVVERSTINASKFENLSSETHITRSTLNNVIVKEGSRREDLGDTRSNEITRCELACCTISGACISRSELADTVVIDTDYMNRVESQNTKFINSGHIEKSHFEGSFVASGSDVERSTVKRSVVADSSQIRRSQLDGIVLTNSQVSKSVLQDCEVVRCEITNTNFTGKTLKYGIWVDGDLVGRTSEEEEVVIKEVPDITSLMQRAIMVSWVVL